MKKICACLFIIAASFLFAAGYSWGQAVILPGGEFLVYESTRDGISQIYRMDRVKVLSFHPPLPLSTLRVTETRISPNLSHQYRYPATYWKWVTEPYARRTEVTIAYTSKRGYSWNIYTNNQKGDSESTPRVGGIEEKRNLRWSPDGRWISYIQKNTQGDRIYRVTASGTVQSNAVAPIEKSIVGHGWLDNNRIIYAYSKQITPIPGAPSYTSYEFVVRRADGTAAGLARYPISVADAMCPFSPCNLIDMKVSHDSRYVALAWEFKMPLSYIAKKVEVLNLQNSIFLVPVKSVIELDDPVFTNKTSDLGSIGWSGGNGKLYVAAKERQSSNPIDDNRMEIFAYELYLYDPSRAITQERYTSNSVYDSFPDGFIDITLLRHLPSMPPGP